MKKFFVRSKVSVPCHEIYIPRHEIHIPKHEICIPNLGTELLQCKKNNYSTVLQELKCVFTTYVEYQPYF